MIRIENARKNKNLAFKKGERVDLVAGKDAIFKVPEGRRGEMRRGFWMGFGDYSRGGRGEGAE